MVGTSTQSDFSNEDMYVHGMTLKQAKQLVSCSRSQQVITLASCGGKKVGVVECGDPNGYPVLWFTGNMGPALSILLYHNIARRHRIRFVCVDRPGYNSSDDIYSEHGVPDLFEFADMINELTLLLGIWQFGLATFSLGAVYGLAYSLSFPERLKGPIFMISPWLSVKTPGTSTMYKGIARYAPNFLIRTTLSTLPHMSNFFNMWSTLGSSHVKTSKRTLSSTSSPSMSDDDDIEDTNVNNLVFSISPGRSYIHNQIYSNGLWNLQNRTGAHLDAMVALEKIDWGFTYEETTYPIKAFVGDIDENVPIQAWMYMSRKMKNIIKLNVIEGGSHYLLYRMDFMEDLFTQIEHSVYT